jgi:hypothetical protein
MSIASSRDTRAYYLFGGIPGQKLARRVSVVQPPGACVAVTGGEDIMGDR